MLTNLFKSCGYTVETVNIWCLWSGLIHCHAVNLYCLEYSLNNPINLHRRAWDLHCWIFWTRKQLRSPSNHPRNQLKSLRGLYTRQHELVAETVYILCILYTPKCKCFISTEAVLALFAVLDGGRLFPAHPWETWKTPPPVCNGAWEAVLMCLNIPFEEITLAEFSRCCIVAPLHII